MLAKVIIAVTAAAFIGALSAGTEAWARGGKGGHGGHKGGITSGWHWNGKGMQGAHGKSGHGPHVSHGKHDFKHNKPDFGHNKHPHSLAQGQWHSSKDKWSQGTWHKASDFGHQKHAGKSSDFHREWQAGGYGGSVGDICINSEFCQGVWYQVTQSGSRTSQSSASYQRNWQAGGP